MVVCWIFRLLVCQSVGRSPGWMVNRSAGMLHNYIIIANIFLNLLLAIRITWIL
jgi:hypothetical protein